MGNAVSFNSPRLQGAQTSDAAVPYAFDTSYAFDPTKTNTFGVPATITFGGNPGPITPILTVPAAPTIGALPLTYSCDPFPSGVSTSSILCPGLANSDIYPGTVSIEFTSGVGFSPPFYTGNYAFSVTSLATVPGTTTTSTVYDTTTTTTSTSYTTLSGTSTATVQGSCPTATAPSVRPTGTGGSTGFVSKSVASTGKIRPSSNSTMPRPTGSLSFRPSGSVSPSGGVSTFKTNSTRSLGGTGTGSIVPASSGTGPVPSGSNLPSFKANSTLARGSTGTGTMISPYTGTARTPSGSSLPSFKANSTLARGSTGTGTILSPSSGTARTPSGSGVPSVTPSFGPTSGSNYNSSTITSSAASPSSVHTITDSSITSTSTSTHVGTTTVTTVITTYVPCSSAVASQGTHTIYTSSLTMSLITKTVTSVTTEYTVFCPATANGPQAAITQITPLPRPMKTIIVTTTLYTCPTPQPPCPTDAPLRKRDVGYDGPDFTLSGGAAGPTITSDITQTTTLPFTSTVTAYSTIDDSQTVTVTQSCGVGGTRPYASTLPSGFGFRLPRARRL